MVGVCFRGHPALGHSFPEGRRHQFVAGRTCEHVAFVGAPQRLWDDFCHSSHGNHVVTTWSPNKSTRAVFDSSIWDLSAQGVRTRPKGAVKHKASIFRQANLAMVDRAGFEPATFRISDLEFAKRTIFGPVGIPD